LADFARFSDRLKAGLDTMEIAAKRTILKVLIKRIEVGDEQVQIVYKVHPRPFADSPTEGDLQHRLKLHNIAQGNALGTRTNPNPVNSSLKGWDKRYPSPSGWNLRGSGSRSRTQGVALGYVIPALQAENTIGALALPKVS